jgi:hypothetical protein
MTNAILSTTRLARRSAALLLALLCLAAAASGHEFGEVTQVRGAQGSPRDGRSHPIEVTEWLSVGTTVTLGAIPSFITVALQEQVIKRTPGARVLVWGTLSSEGIGEFTVEKAEAPEPESTTGRFLLGLVVPRGKLWMALSQAVAHTVSVLTPQLKAVSGTTSFRMLVDPVAGTFLTTDEGEVRAELPTGEVFRVTAGHWLLVPPKGTIQRGANDHLPDSLEDPPLLDCCDFRTEVP